MWEEASVGTGGPAGGRCRGAGRGLKFTITSHRGQTPGLTKGGNQCEGPVRLHSAGGVVAGARELSAQLYHHGHHAGLTGAHPTAGHRGQDLTSEDHWLRDTTLI